MTTPGEKPQAPRRDFFDVYRLAIEDLQATKALGQRIDSFYITILTLLLTADAYEIATSHFATWTSTVVTAGVAVVGLAVTARWRQGAANLYRLVRNRYGWLRDAEDPALHPEMSAMGANIFSQEYLAVYHKRPHTSPVKEADQGAANQERSVTVFYNRTVFLQALSMAVFVAIPVIIGAVTWLTLNPTVMLAIQRALP